MLSYPLHYFCMLQLVLNRTLFHLIFDKVPGIYTNFVSVCQSIELLLPYWTTLLFCLGFEYTTFLVRGYIYLTVVVCLQSTPILSKKKCFVHLYFYLKISRPWTAAKKIPLWYFFLYKHLECSQCGTNTIYWIYFLVWRKKILQPLVQTIGHLDFKRIEYYCSHF